jgi:hypothetical protein
MARSALFSTFPTDVRGRRSRMMTRRGWTTDEYEQWLADMLTYALLRDALG